MILFCGGRVKGYRTTIFSYHTFIPVFVFFLVDFATSHREEKWSDLVLKKYIHLRTVHE